MKHKVYGKKLNRDVKERKALFRSLAYSFIMHGKIKTTYAKAKAVTSLIEKLVTKAKDGSRTSIIQISSFLNSKEPVKKLVEDIAPRFQNKIGGYIRMIRLANRQGDNAQEVLMEWTVTKPEVPKSAEKKTVIKKGKTKGKDKPEKDPANKK
ncbi:50S ribosomal protein L17 [Candidatus Gottesmanbacteria bacterium RIFCSPHIGHO2_02_FULL_40_24]|uniref:50S ribosomal protein L17 n=1 Tax=Candidatus Gottesmanbacteria bacterium RIFCSPHIGHO2_01_FULL_40_15 TaxID=1798376 RepID=A0A1F5Z779_9BACT|nr:MAG: 50S ribosomal protein L17 [Candidatus Gottesmanbacteria bacterium RIFCSPHIGHO2_01_FULL_40_15]OGG18239.1 MAG: 50S ribosomal protein L17 [Candidatus Gottesmanbacteria bacterium RIFCSPHIGHO2_02_FULL_40_24]OGG22905.1 MAG: 50S ribosomal protein L17 [Candidatus Gottesmanbacteria bacterium RIFCSPLOWO2_01_FULL_40_10]OGG23523.1 MAG: 50S ribosomal protein L17 [Candidatus Gottesmanbacteria bacterium RIFCSPHIGHO2_12_FULL_40_13]OGG32477.1 MAG: 50S ribosomal protein L17 [Candidatus Gottesmanbacteria 